MLLYDFKQDLAAYLATTPPAVKTRTLEQVAKARAEDKIPEAIAPEKNSAAMIAFIVARGAVGAGMVVVLFTVRG